MQGLLKKFLSNNKFGGGGFSVTWALVGYIAMRRTTRAGWVSPWPDHPDARFPCGPPVEELCSVSGCIAREAEGTDGRMNDTPLDLYADARRAWAAVPAEARADFAVYAYRLWLVQFEGGQEAEIDLWWEPAIAPVPDTFVRLGWDAVVGGNGHSFGCSPLSCNSGSDVVRCPELNRYCLVADERAAMALARSFSIAQPEPGPYCVVEVWRDTASDAEPGAAADGRGM
jgi:hypothetical protein